MSHDDTSDSRLLDAAATEFALHGLLAADLGRIADTAGVDRAEIGSSGDDRAALFDRAVERLVLRGVGGVRFDSDLPRAAGALFDAMLDDPRLGRLMMWRALERPLVPDGERAMYHEALAEIEDDRGGAVGLETFTAPELLSFVLAISTAEQSVPKPLAERVTRGADRDRRTRREHVEEAVRRIVGNHA